jgi:L-ascorbate metabolism protein UlaG (beta-lactamase superfamily)
MHGLFARLGSALALLLSSAAAPAAERDAPVKAVWIGGPTLLFRFGPIMIVTDPVLGQGASAFRMFDPNSGKEDAAHGRLRPLPDLPLEEADLVLVSHDHADHLDEAALARLGKRPFLVPLGQVERLKGRGVDQVLGLPWRAAHTIRKDGYSITITAVPAHHSERPDVRKMLGDVNGYWLDFRHGAYRRTVYWTGDSFPVAAELGSNLRRPDLLVPHLGGVGAGGPFGQVSMGAREALSFARAVEPKRVLPIHHSTFSLYREPIDRFARAAKGQKWKLDMVDEGEELVLN